MENTNAPVIIVTEEKRRRKGLIWIAGGAALAVAAVGGGTFALWSDSAAFNGGTITAGDLDLRKVAETAFYDISPDRLDVAPVYDNGDEETGTVLADTADHLAVGATGDVLAGTQMKGHVIDEIADWRIVPGDTIAAVMPTTIHLVGDNLVAELSVAADALALNTAGTTDVDVLDDDSEEPKVDEPLGDDAGFDDASSGLTYTYTVYGTDGEVVGDLYDHVEIDSTWDGHIAYFDAATDGQTAGEPDADDVTGVIPVDTDTGLLNVTVVIEATFNDVDDRTDVGAAEVIGDVDLTLAQLRQATKAIDGTTTGVGAQQ